MPEINMIFAFDRDEALDQTAHQLEDRLSQMDIVEEVEAAPERMRAITGLEIAAAIGVTVLLVRSSRELVEEVRKLVTEIKGLMVDLRDLKNVYVDVGTRRIPIDELGDEELQELAATS